MKSPQLLLALLAILAAGVLPAAALTTYTDGQPQMTAVISGTNEFSPGQDAVITLVLQNRGLTTMANSWEGYSAVAAETTRPDFSREYYAGQGNANMPRDDIPMTAKMVTVGLSSGNAPIVIRTDPQNLGDIASMSSMTAQVQAKITTNATEGEYQLPATITYTYLARSNELAADTLQSLYVRKSVVVPVTIRIKPRVKIDVLNAVPDRISVGTSGYLNLTIKNTGSEDGKKATVRLIRNGNSPLTPTDSSVFVGDFPMDGVVACRYKVSVSNDAQNQTYPVDVVVSYQNREGDIVTSDPDTIGVPVVAKLQFSAIPDSAAVAQGSETVITIRYRNDGVLTAYDAQARLSAVSPLSSADNVAYLGDVRPGESAVARFQLGASGDAAPGTYALDSEVRYRDPLANSQISDTFKVPVQVVPKPATSGLVQVLVAALVLAGVAGAGYYLLVMRKKK